MDVIMVKTKVQKYHFPDRNIGTSNDREDMNKVVPKMTTHPRVEHLGNSLVVSRHQVSRTSGNLNVRPNKGEVGFQTLGHEGLLV